VWYICGVNLGVLLQIERTMQKKKVEVGSDRFE
jgi:hypothetical protein